MSHPQDTPAQDQDRADIDAREDWMRGERRRAARSTASRTCPTCKREGALTRYEAAKGYQCAQCTARDEGTGF